VVVVAVDADAVDTVVVVGTMLIPSIQCVGGNVNDTVVLSDVSFG
jgi:hypothetical protein